MVPASEQDPRLSINVAKTVATLPEKLPTLRESFTPETFPIHNVIAFLRHNAGRVIGLLGANTYKDAVRFEEILLEVIEEAADPQRDAAVDRIRELTYYHTIRVLELILLSEKAGDLLARIDDIGVRLSKTEAINIVLRRQVKTDPLTKLYNKEGFNEEGAMVFDYCKGKGIPLSALYIDLDFFKLVNDIYGHDVGDAVLKAFTRMIIEEFRGSDVAFQGRFDDSKAADSDPDTVIGRDGWRGICCSFALYRS